MRGLLDFLQHPPGFLLADDWRVAPGAPTGDCVQPDLPMHMQMSAMGEWRRSPHAGRPGSWLTWLKEGHRDAGLDRAWFWSLGCRSDREPCAVGAGVGIAALALVSWSPKQLAPRRRQSQAHGSCQKA